METQIINIQISTVDEALHLQNLATMNIQKYQSNPVVGQEQYQNNLIRMWRDVHGQAGKALNSLQEADEVA